MNHYNFSDIYVGQEESFSVTVEEEMLDIFLKMTNDTNPLHTDREYARSKGFPDRVVYGLLTGSFLSTLAGVYLPGENALIHSVELDFHKPVFVGDNLFIKGVVKSKNDSFGFVDLKVEMINQEKEKILKGKMRIGLI